MSMDKLMLWSDRKVPPVPSADDPFQPFLELYLHPGDTCRGAVIVLPGGGYCNRAFHEGEPIAKRYNELGFHAFVLQYRVAPYVYPAPQEDVLRAVRLVRGNAEKWHVKADKIAVLGFSAGGHLACSSGIVYDEIPAKNGDEYDTVSARPDLTVLCYPVITALRPYAHVGSFLNLLGHEYSEEEGRRYSWNLRVKKNTPPSFLWHTAEDGAVPVQNSLEYAKALRENGIPFELHVFPNGPHGLGLGGENYPELHVWPELSAVWMKNLAGDVREDGLF